MAESPPPATFSLSDCLTLAEKERLYYDVVLKHDFYGSSYGDAWSPLPYQQMAELLAKIYQPQRHIDVGCGKGLLVLAMRQRGIASFGIDFSPALIAQADPEIQSYLQVLDTENWINRGGISDADLITYMEVFEHLPISVSRSVLRTLHDSFRGHLMVTTPSYGIDDRWKLGMITNAGTPSWLEDMAANRPFRQIVLENGLPHFGHITLCSYRWWTDFFLSNGWVRAIDFELETARGFTALLKQHNWQPYLLERLLPETLVIDTVATDQLGHGWHDAEPDQFAPGRWTNGRGEIYFSSDRKWKAVEIAFSAPVENVVRDYGVSVLIERQVRNDEYEFRWQPVFISPQVAVSIRQKMQTIRFDVPWPMEKIPEKGNVIRLTLLSPAFCPADYTLSADNRTLGLFVHRVVIDSQ